MTYHIPCSNPKLDKTMNSEQFNQVVEAIMEGKYSWACVLLLRFAGYNPLHYIPYRTYNRLLKENCQVGRHTNCKTDTLNTDNQNAAIGSESLESRKCLNKIKDLGYLEAIAEPQVRGNGGHFDPWLVIKTQKINSIFRELK